MGFQIKLGVKNNWNRLRDNFSEARKGEIGERLGIDRGELS